MNELKNIIRKYEDLKTGNLQCVLATVVRVEGSSYRRAGARMIVDEAGNMFGAISGGCLEGDALKKALLALHRNEKKLIVYDTSDENDAVVGAQLGCNGLIKVLFEPIDFQDSSNPVEILKWADAQAHGAKVLIQFSDSVQIIGTIAAIDHHSNVLCFENPLSFGLMEEILKSENVAEGYFHIYENEFFINKIKPPLQLLIIGAGNDAVVLSNMAGLLGWEISILDGRHTHTSAHRFQEGCQVYLGDASEVLKYVKYPENTAVVLVSHNFQYDLKVLKQLLTVKNIPYIGILGPKNKFNKLLDLLKEESITVNTDDHSRLFSPMGFDIGAETPAEIALATLAEIQAVIKQKNGGSLRNKSGRIHD